MEHAQVIVHEPDSRIADRLEALSTEHGFVLRSVRSAEACLNALARHGPGVVIVKVGRDLERELGLLERLDVLYPQAPVLAVSDSENLVLESLCWDLGARYVLFPPQPMELLRELVLTLLRAPA